MSEDLLTHNEKELLMDVLQLACEMATSIKTDIEEDPASASNETIILLNKFIDKMDDFNQALEKGANGLQ